ncbi:FAD binding domain-containing protein [Thozetella sp. PMI_491]|nr:FAD binding domain-containing protein [Thozetella sp. PMI_491]
MELVLFALAFLLAIPAAQSTARRGFKGSIDTYPPHENAVCSYLRSLHPNHTFFPKSAGYIYETRAEYWSATLYDGPACVFVPQSAQDVAAAVTIAALTSSKFAVRGGGHMPIPGYNNINSEGFLLSTSNLTTLSLSGDSSTVSVGSGNRWRDVYSYLQPFGLAAVGGRIGDVGVAGFLLGGGISFYSSQYGFGSDNIVAYEVVLASGLLVKVTADNHFSDLFWALKGGANSFGIVTRFDIETVNSPEVWVGISQYYQSQSEQYLDAVYNFAKYGALDPKAAIIPTIINFPSIGIVAYAAARFYDSNVQNSTVFANFTAPHLEPVADSFTLQPLATYITTTDPLQPVGLRQDFRALSCVVDKEAIEFIHDTFLAEVSSTLGAVAGLQASVTFQPVSKQFIEQGIHRGGNPQGVDPVEAPYFWVVENWTWTNADDDDQVHAFADSITATINQWLAKNSYAVPYIYLNDAGAGQPVFGSYPARNLNKLKEIRAKYDPLGVYTNLLVGGWKVMNS